MPGLFLLCLFLLGLSGCSPLMPIRKAQYAAAPPACTALYQQHAEGQPIDDPHHECWQRSLEQMRDYDLVFTEFDEQGWVARQVGEDTDRLTETMDTLRRLQKQSPGQRISLVVYVHGWKHDAQANDRNVREFRTLLQSLAIQDSERPEAERYRVVGLYVGWRGGSVPLPLLEELTFWDRKSTAKRIAGGSVQELFVRLDHWRDSESQESQDRARSDQPAPGNRVRMLTIGHSMGGQILLESLTGTFVHATTRKGKTHLSRYGDLVIVINPAIEGTRYEALHAASRRIESEYLSDQLPLLINITGQADRATGIAFPAARFLNTFFQHTASPEQFKANLLPPGHDPRYQTHRLTVCPADAANAKDCIPSVCTESDPATRGLRPFVDPVNMPTTSLLRGETRLTEVASRRAGAGYGLDERYCTGAHLVATPNWSPPWNPFWTVSAAPEVIHGHNDIYNRHLQGFIRVMHGLVMRAVR
jgi:hypothetical protein